MVTVAKELKAEEIVLAVQEEENSVRSAECLALGRWGDWGRGGRQAHLREPLKRQATKRPGRPGTSRSTSMTK